MNDNETRLCLKNPAEWWLEPDSFQQEPTYEVGTDKNYKVPPRPLLAKYRAKLLCYECPFLASCRDSAWGEPAHIWAGLDYRERYKARMVGQVVVRVPKYVNTYNDASRRDVIGKRFISGEDIHEIAASLDRSVPTIWYHISRILVQARLEQEERLWSITPPPPFPEGMSAPRFRHGAASSSGWVTDLPTPGSVSC